MQSSIALDSFQTLNSYFRFLNLEQNSEKFPKGCAPGTPLLKFYPLSKEIDWFGIFEKNFDFRFVNEFISQIPDFDLKI